MVGAVSSVRRALLGCNNGWLDPILAVLLVAIVIALLRGGRLSNLAEVRLRWWWLLLIGLAMQLAANVISTDVAVWLILGSYVVLILVVAANRKQEGMWLAGIGILMNFSVIALNQGMPVLPEAAVLAGADSTDLLLDAKHVILDSSSKLVFFTDIIPIRFLRQVISMGDVFLAVGLGRYLESQLRRPQTWFRHPELGRPGSAAPS